MSELPFGRSVEEFLKQHPVEQQEDASILSKEDMNVCPNEALEETEGSEMAQLWSRDPQVRIAKEKAHQFLGLACKPSGAVRNKLRQLGFADSVIQTVLEQLEQDGYIQDEKLACRRIRKQCQGRRNENRQVLYQRLVHQGFRSDAVLRALDQVLPDEQQLVRAYLLARHGDWIRNLQMIQRTEGCLPHHWLYQEDSVRIVRQAARRGFAPQLVRSAVEQILGEDQYA